MVSSTAVSVSPLVCTISAGPFVVTFSITGILSSSAGLKEADIVTLCHLPGSQSKYLDIEELIYTQRPAFSLELQCRGTVRLHDSLRWSEAIPGILCQCKYTSRQRKDKQALLSPASLSTRQAQAQSRTNALAERVSDHRTISQDTLSP